MMQKCDETHSRWDANHVEKTFTSHQLTSFTYLTWLIHAEIWIMSEKIGTSHRLTWFTYAPWLIHAEIWTMSKKHSRLWLVTFALRCKTPKHFWIEWCSSQRLVFFLKKMCVTAKTVMNQALIPLFDCIVILKMKWVMSQGNIKHSYSIFILKCVTIQWNKKHSHSTLKHSYSIFQTLKSIRTPFFKH